MEQKRAMTDREQADSSIANSHQLTSSQLHEIFTTYFLGQKPTFERGYNLKCAMTDSVRNLQLQIRTA